jgi:hypothetical protein
VTVQRRFRPFRTAVVLEDLGPDDRVLVECACGHTEELTAAMLATAGVVKSEN